MTNVIYIFTSQQLAELTGISHRSILRQCRKGQIPHHRVSKTIWFTSADLNAIAEQGAQPARYRRHARFRS